MSPTDPAPPRAKDPARSPTVLWAEDNANDRMLIRAALDDLTPAPDVTFLADGVLLLEALQTSPPGLVVLDLKMPRLGGLDVLRQIRGRPAGDAIPVVIFTSGNRPSEIRDCSALGIAEIVHKPVDFDQFREAVQHILQLARPLIVARPSLLLASPGTSTP